jgi:hypothetical protein
VLTNVLFWVFVLLLVSRLATVLRRPERIYEFPQFMTATFGIFILPQAVSLVRFPGAASEAAVQRVLWMGCLCVAACISGYHLATHSRASQPPLALHLGKLKQAGTAFVVCGLVASYLLRTINIQTNDFGGWTGPATVYAFFQQLAYPGFAICLLMMLHKWTVVSVGATAIAAIVPLQSMMFGRREPAALFALSIGLIVYFRLGLRPPRWLTTLSVAGAMLAIPATATYRQLRLEGDWNGVRQIELLDNFRQFLNDESVLELRNAAMLIDSTRRSGGYQYGAGYWNHLVFRYVPAQILGQEFKESLRIKANVELVDRELTTLGYANPIGSTVTGLGDSFQQFGYFGCLFFALLGMLFSRIWQAASAPNAVFSQLLYTMTCVSAMRSVTHWTLDFLPGLVYSTLFLGVAAWYAHLPSSAEAGRWLILSKQRYPSHEPPQKHQSPAKHLGYDENKHCAAQSTTK